MHNGAFKTLREVVDHYDDVLKSITLFDFSKLLPLLLSEQEKSDLVEFLETGLTDPSSRNLNATVAAPTSVPSGLSIDRQLVCRRWQRTSPDWRKKNGNSENCFRSCFVVG